MGAARSELAAKKSTIPTAQQQTLRVSDRKKKLEKNARN
jgi:hypothetical protein